MDVCACGCMHGCRCNSTYSIIRPGNCDHFWYLNTSVLYCIAWNISERLFCDLVRFPFAAVVIDANAFEPEMIMSIVSD